MTMSTSTGDDSRGRAGPATGLSPVPDRVPHLRATRLLPERHRRLPTGRAAAVRSIRVAVAGVATPAIDVGYAAMSSGDGTDRGMLRPRLAAQIAAWVRFLTSIFRRIVLI